MRRWSECGWNYAVIKAVVIVLRLRGITPVGENRLRRYEVGRGPAAASVGKHGLRRDEVGRGPAAAASVM